MKQTFYLLQVEWCRNVFCASCGDWIYHYEVDQGIKKPMGAVSFPLEAYGHGIILHTREKIPITMLLQVAQVHRGI